MNYSNSCQPEDFQFHHVQFQTSSNQTMPSNNPTPGLTAHIWGDNQLTSFESPAYNLNNTDCQSTLADRGDYRPAYQLNDTTNNSYNYQLTSVRTGQHNPTFHSTNTTNNNQFPAHFNNNLPNNFLTNLHYVDNTLHKMNQRVEMCQRNLESLQQRYNQVSPHPTLVDRYDAIIHQKLYFQSQKNQMEGRKALLMRMMSNSTLQMAQHEKQSLPPTHSHSHLLTPPLTPQSPLPPPEYPQQSTVSDFPTSTPCISHFKVLDIPSASCKPEIKVELKPFISSNLKPSKQRIESAVIDLTSDGDDEIPTKKVKIKSIDISKVCSTNNDQLIGSVFYSLNPELSKRIDQMAEQGCEKYFIKQQLPDVMEIVSPEVAFGSEEFNKIIERETSRLSEKNITIGNKQLAPIDVKTEKIVGENDQHPTNNDKSFSLRIEQVSTTDFHGFPSVIEEGPKFIVSDDNLHVELYEEEPDVSSKPIISSNCYVSRTDKNKDDISLVPITTDDKLASGSEEEESSDSLDLPPVAGFKSIPSKRIESIEKHRSVSATDVKKMSEQMNTDVRLGFRNSMKSYESPRQSKSEDSERLKSRKNDERLKDSHHSSMNTSSKQHHHSKLHKQSSSHIRWSSIYPTSANGDENGKGSDTSSTRSSSFRGSLLSSSKESTKDSRTPLKQTTENVAPKKTLKTDYSSSQNEKHARSNTFPPHTSLINKDCNQGSSGKSNRSKRLAGESDISRRKPTLTPPQPPSKMNDVQRMYVADKILKKRLTSRNKKLGNAKKKPIKTNNSNLLKIPTSPIAKASPLSFQCYKLGQNSKEVSSKHVDKTSITKSSTKKPAGAFDTPKKISSTVGEKKLKKSSDFNRNFLAVFDDHYSM